MKSLVELALIARGVTEQDYLRTACAIALYRLEYLFRDARRFIEYVEQVTARDASDGFSFARSEADDLAKVGRFEPSAREVADLALDERRVWARSRDEYLLRV